VLGPATCAASWRLGCEWNCDIEKQNGRDTSGLDGAGYCLSTNGGPLIRFPLRSIVTLTLSPTWTKGMPLFIP
jgi:hypothetical protein